MPGSSAPPRWPSSPPTRLAPLRAPRGVVNGSPAGCADPQTSLKASSSHCPPPRKGDFGMPTFDTPAPIAAMIEVAVGDVRIIASDRSDTVVTVHPSDSGADLDVRAAEQTRVEYADGRLFVKAPKPRTLGIFGRPGSID